ncbi:YdcF family protein [Coleofasciculus sp. LEGE 07081]|uniref:YdcF family protein n=1 Tax=Coleofasciculus sp. LEGE 07081 TaxID=2777967 RepID=UPI0034DAD0A7
MWRNGIRFHHHLQRNWRRLLCLGLLGLAIFLVGWLLLNTLRLQTAASAPVDTVFVLGGSIRREVYAAEFAKEHPQTRVLISQGSEPPCILLVFQKFKAPIRQVWLEECAESTFDNFYFNIPLLRQWNVRNVKLITSPTHLPRAEWMAQILLGAQGIWVEVTPVEELGIPGNQESWLKTGLDVTRSLIWAVLSQVIQPHCSQLTPLTDVDLAVWQKLDFKCENQWWLRLE